MREIEIHDYARQLLEAHGAKAVAEAAQNAIDLEAKGEVELARTWRHIEGALSSCVGRTKAEAAGSRVTRHA